MRYLRAALPLLVFGILLLTPHLAEAATANFFGPIFPKECDCPLSAPDWGCVLAAIQNLINFAISIGTVIFVLIAAYAGVLLMASSVNAENKKLAKSMLLNTFVGLLITLSAWIAVDFIMKVLYNPAAGGSGVAHFGPWNSILAENQEKKCLTPRTPPAGPTSAGGYTTTPGSGTGTQDNSPGESSARSQLSAAGITVNKAACADGVRYQDAPGGDGCTNVGGLQPTTISQIIEIHSSCDCAVQVTGGSELGHSSSHTNGVKVDLHQSSQLNTFLEGVLVRTGTRGGDNGGPVYEDHCGNQYVKEVDHWDIHVSSICSI